MEPLTLIGAIIGILAAIAGIIAAIVQVREYREKRHEKPEGPGKEDQPLTLPSVPPIPHNLPPRSEFIGREAEKARVHEALRSRSYLVSVDGIGGIGKTALALEVAHECLRASRSEELADRVATFNGFIWTTAKDRDLTLNGLLDAIARTLDYPGIMQQPVEEKRIAVRKLLQEKPYLLIVDNFETITDAGVRDFLLDLPEPSRALITTREQKLCQVWTISLKDLTEPEALALIRNEGKRLELASLEHAEDRVLLHLYQATGGAPLAIKWAVGQIKQRGQSLDTVLAALHDARGSIFDSIFARSWDLLSKSARQVLIVMPLFATSASWEGIGAASDIHHFALDEALGQLVEMSLVDPTDELDLARRRYSIHPLTRAFAMAQLQQEPDTLRTAQERLVEFFRVFTKKHGGFWHHEGFAQLEPELANIVAIIQRCWDQRLGNLVLDTVHNIVVFMFQHGSWNDLMALAQKAVEQAIEAGDDLSAARLQVTPIASVSRHQGNLDSAEEQAASALAVFERLGQERESALAKRELGRIARERGDLERAEQNLRDALTFSRSSWDERLTYLVTTNLADVALQRGDLETAWSLCNDVLPSARQFGDSDRIAQLLSVLGSVAGQRGDFQQAEELWTESLAHMKKTGCLDGVAEALFGLAKIAIETGKQENARQMLSDALGIYQQLGIKSRIQEIEELLTGLLNPMEYMERKDTN